MKSLLLISRHSPYGSSYAREALDVAFSAAAFDIKTAILFSGDGIYQLLDNQIPPAGRKNHRAVLDSLALYDVEQLYLDEAALVARGFSPSDISLPVTSCSQDQLKALLNQFDQVLTF